jgi:hypothetical protein
MERKQSDRDDLDWIVLQSAAATRTGLGLELERC